MIAKELLFKVALFCCLEIKNAIEFINSILLYPEPGSNRHAFRHWCLRPTRLPIPPSGHGLN